MTEVGSANYDAMKSLVLFSLFYIIGFVACTSGTEMTYLTWYSRDGESGGSESSQIQLRREREKKKIDEMRRISKMFYFMNWNSFGEVQFLVVVTFLFDSCIGAYPILVMTF